jgi:hypothetical protein
MPIFEYDISESEWPSGLPGPLVNSLRLVAGTNVSRRKTQSNDYELRRFGSPEPDQWDATFRFSDANLLTFSLFYDADLELGTKFFQPTWLSLLAYSTEYYIKFMGYLRESGNRLAAFGYTDFAATFRAMRIS